MILSEQVTKMKETIGLLVIFLAVPSIVCPPVNPPKPVEAGSQADTNFDTGLEYDKYLREVVSVLEQDEDFKKKLENSNATDVKNGNIAYQLEFVSHHVREKLDELKRRELQRLRDLIAQKLKSQNGTEIIREILSRGLSDLDKNGPGHIDVVNPHSFEIEDLKKLISKTTSDLDEMDKKRRHEFKEYEMRKEHERRMNMSNMNEQERKQAQEEFEAQIAKHKDHPKVHHPGSKAQFEEVWEERDHLDKADFDAKTFFKLHDLDKDGMWYEDEIRALFQKELDKVYLEDASEDDMMERYEEMNRMREHLVNEVDVNKDKIISYEEYVNYVNGENFDKDEGWETLDEEPQFTDEEFEEYERLMGEESDRMGAYEDHVQPGEINIPHQEQPNVVQMQQGGAPAPPNTLDEAHNQQQQFNQHQQLNQQQVNQGQVPQQQVNQGQVPQQQVNQGQVPQQQVNQAQVPQQQVNQGQVPQQQVNQGQVPQQQVNQGQVPQQQMNQGQVPQQQVNQGQVPQQQVNQQQVPVGNGV